MLVLQVQLLAYFDKYGHLAYNLILLNLFPKFQVLHEGEGSPLYVQVLCVLKGGSVLRREWGALPKHRAQSIDLTAIVKENGLTAGDVERIYLLITNADPRQTAPYKIRLS